MNELDTLLRLMNKATLHGAFDINEVDLAIKAINNLSVKLKEESKEKKDEQLPEIKTETGNKTKK